MVFALAAPGIERKVEAYYQDKSIRYPEEEEQEEEEQKQEETETQTQENTEEIPQTTTVIQELTLEDYEKLYTEMFQAAGKRGKPW